MARHQEWDAEFRKTIAEWFSEETGKDFDEVINFLNFKDEEDVFCS